MNTTPDGRTYDPNDYKVVEFHNSTDFDFTPELGAMYDGRPLFVGLGEKKQFPYHIGNRLAENLAKAVMLKGAPAHDPNDKNPSGTSLWNDVKLDKLKASYLTELYIEEKPISQSQTDMLMSKVAELEKLVKKEDKKEESSSSYRDKQEIIAELEAKGIAHDKRKNKEELEKLL